MMIRFRVVVDDTCQKKNQTHQFESFNQELIGIMLNKGCTDEEIKNFLGVLQIWSNKMINWGEKLRILLYLEWSFKKNPKSKKSLDLDKYLWRNLGVKPR